MTPSSTMVTYLGNCQKYLLMGLPYFCFTLLVLTFPSFSLLLTYLSVKNSGSSLYWLSRGLRSTAGAWLGRELGLNPSFQTEYYRVSKKTSHFLNSWTIALPLPFGCLNPLWKSFPQIKLGFSKTEIQRVTFLGASLYIGYHFRKVKTQEHWAGYQDVYFVCYNSISDWKLNINPTQSHLRLA